MSLNCQQFLDSIKSTEWVKTEISRDLMIDHVESCEECRNIIRRRLEGIFECGPVLSPHFVRGVILGIKDGLRRRAQNN